MSNHSRLVALLVATSPMAIDQALAQSVRLDEIVVEGRGTTGSTAGPATGPIDGYVAKESATGTKTATPLIETPQSITVVGQQQIRNLNEQTIDQALTYASGVRSGFFGFDPRTDWFLIRGFPAQVSGYFLDGLQLLSPDFGTFKLEPFGLERIEVLKGPASVLYGGSNTGGIINAVSKRPTEVPHGLLEVGINNYGNKYAAFDLSGPVSKKSDNQFFYRVEGYARGGGTQVDFQNDDRLYVAPSLAWVPDAATNVTFISSYQQDRTKGANFLPYVGTVTPALYGRIPTSLFTSDPNFDRFRRNQGLLGYSAEHKFSDTLAVRQNVRYADLRIDSQTLFGGGYALTPADAQLARFNFNTAPRVTEFAVDNQVEGRFATGPLAHTVLAGIDYKHFTIADNQGFGFGANYNFNLINPNYNTVILPTTPFAAYKNTQDQLGEYLQDQIKLGGFTLVLSGRHDGLMTNLENRLTPANSTSNNDEAFTGRAGLIYTSAIGLAPYATVATSFDPQLGVNTSSMKALVPMTGQLKELGVKYQPTGMNITLDGALFDLTQQNVLTTDPTNVVNTVQTGEQNSRGFELQAAGNITPEFSVLGSYTGYRIRTTRDLNPALVGKVPVRIPQNFGAIFLDYTIQTGALKGLGAGAGPRYNGSSFADQANTLAVPSYVLADVNVHYETGRWRAALNIRNVADKTFVASCSSPNACFYGERRTALVNVTYKW